MVAGGRTTVAERGGEVVGLLVLAISDEGMFVDNVAVAPDAQGGGVGRALLERAEAEALGAGFAAIHLYTHELMSENLALYRRIGYHEYDRRRHGDATLVYMRKPLEHDAAERARARLDASRAAVCDSIEPWEHGTVGRWSACPSYYEYNLVRVTDDPRMSAAELIEFADRALAGLEHRRVDFDRIEPAEGVRGEFEAAGWKATRLVWMRHELPLPAPASTVAVEEVDYDQASELRLAWHREDFGDNHDPMPYMERAREISLAAGARVLAVREGGAPVGFAQYERDAEGAEITHAYVLPEHRGGGRGTALTRAAIEAASGPGDLWIIADDEDRPKQLYARLGFRPVWTMMEFLRLPPS